MMKLLTAFLCLFFLNCSTPAEQANSSTLAEEARSRPVRQAEEQTAPRMELSEEALLGKISPAQDTGFIRIAARFTQKEAIYLRNQAYRDFVRMAEAAAAEGIRLEIISAMRNFAAQKSIWEAKWNGKRKVSGMDLSRAMPEPEERALKILEYSSMPGTSRHHWGTDIDLNALNNRFFAEGKGKKIYDWLLAHAHKYGFCQVYTEHGPDRPFGYNEEKWHWSYMPLASQFLEQYNEKISYAKLGGFEGAAVARDIEAIRKYVNGIASRCRDWSE